MEDVVYTAIGVAFEVAVLWVASRITSVDLSFKEILIAVCAAGVVSLIPAVGWVLSILVLFYLLKQFSKADIWPDIILMVVVSRLVSTLTLVALGAI